jgi:hypothetical protein
MKLSDLVGERAEAEVEFTGGKITVGYRPAVITPRYLESGKTIQEALSDVLVDWPLETDSGEPIPTTTEGLQDVPGEVQEQVWLGILRARRPNPRPAGNSGANSETSASA